MPTHAEKRRLPYSPEQLFDLVAAVERYPEFLPWCLGARVSDRRENTVKADLVIGFKIFRERFTTNVVLDRPRRIDVSYLRGPFRHLNNHWCFQAVNEGACEIDFFIDFEFRTRLLQRAITPLFNEAVRRMVDAFESRARALYGRPNRTSAAPRRKRA